MPCGEILIHIIQSKSKGERLALLFAALHSLPPADTEHGAYERLSQTMDLIEDAYTNIPHNPNSWGEDGRMYPPKLDHRYPTSNPYVFCYRTRKQDVLIGFNGALKIVRRKDSEVLFEQAGQDGREVNQL